MPTPSEPSPSTEAPDGPPPRPLNIVLIGFMATGKTTIGRRLAKKAGFKFIDCDSEIEKQQGMKISEIFADHGEDYFRALEAEYLRTLQAREKLIISTGGGVVTREAARQILPSLGYVVWLHAKKRDIHERVMRNANRPLVHTRDPWLTIKTLLRTRKPMYKEVADIKIKTHALTIDESVRGILDSACYYFSQQRKDAPAVCSNQND